MLLDKVIDFYHTSKLRADSESAVWEIGREVIKEVRSMTDANGRYGCCAVKGDFAKETLIGIPVEVGDGDKLRIRFRYPGGKEMVFEANLYFLRRK